MDHQDPHGNNLFNGHVQSAFMSKTLGRNTIKLAGAYSPSFVSKNEIIMSHYLNFTFTLF